MLFSLFFGAGNLDISAHSWPYSGSSKYVDWYARLCPYRHITPLYYCYCCCIL
ncbi:hypothetical protein ACVNPZ_01370 [Staphylococcus aureus]